MCALDMRKVVAWLLAVGLSAGVLAACGDDGGSGDGDGAGAPGVVTDQEYLGHQLREIPADGAPAVDLQVEADDHGGWNLRLQIERFTFTPAQTGAEARAGQGHAHVYVDDQKFSRAYGEWFYLPAAAVGEGEHTVLVTLNADDHTVWAPGGEPATAQAAVDGTADGQGHEHGEDGEDVELLEFTITDGRADPPLDRVTVERGRTVRIVVASDQPDEVHLHGYDLTAPIGPDAEGTIEFVADQTGLFELETHDSGLILLQLQIQ